MNRYGLQIENINHRDMLCRLYMDCTQVHCCVKLESFYEIRIVAININKKKQAYMAAKL